MINEFFLAMYVKAVESGRLDINFVPMPYAEKVREILKIPTK